MNKFLMYLLFFFLVSTGIYQIGNAQNSGKPQRLGGFQANLITGINLSQLEGDNLSGYSMLGLRTGTQINYALSPSKGLAIGLFYEEKGSSDSFSVISKENQTRTRMRYLSIPLDIYFDSGYRPDINKYRIRIQIGTSLGRLFSGSSDLPIIGDNIDLFKAFDISPNIGITYFLSKRSGINLRFERSVTSIMNEDLSAGLNNLRSYLFSLQYVYSL